MNTNNGIILDQLLTFLQSDHKAFLEYRSIFFFFTNINGVLIQAIFVSFDIWLKRLNIF